MCFLHSQSQLNELAAKIWSKLLLAFEPNQQSYSHLTAPPNRLTASRPPASSAYSNLFLWLVENDHRHCNNRSPSRTSVIDSSASINFIGKRITNPRPIEKEPAVRLYCEYTIECHHSGDQSPSYSNHIQTSHSVHHLQFVSSFFSLSRLVLNDCRSGCSQFDIYISQHKFGYDELLLWPTSRTEIVAGQMRMRRDSTSHAMIIFPCLFL